MKNNYIDNISLVVSSCDLYEDAWYPYFELLKKYWPDHPKEIYLITEGRKYFDPELKIKVHCDSGKWSTRLYNVLKEIKTKYIIFSLDDFFIRSKVDSGQIKKCYSWMEENSNIAVCRLVDSDNNKLVKTELYDDFYIADSSVKYRLETQVALWNRETLMSFITLDEDAWQFEALGSKRIINTEKIFLWKTNREGSNHYDYDNKTCGITQGQWLWNNVKLFKENDIVGVNYRRLGILSEKKFLFRKSHFYKKNKNFFEKLMTPIWRIAIKSIKLRNACCVMGIKNGLIYYFMNR